MTNWFFISSAFCCQFSSTENHSALQQTTLQLIQMSMLALLAFTKTTFFAWLDPKWAFGLLLIAHITQRQTTLHFNLVILLSLATFGEARKIGFWQSKCTLGPVDTLICFHWKSLKMKANFFKLWSIDTADDYFMQGIYSSKDKLLLYNFGKQPEINMKLVFQWLLSYELHCNEINFAHTFTAAADKQLMQW